MLPHAQTDTLQFLTYLSKTFQLLLGVRVSYKRHSYTFHGKTFALPLPLPVGDHRIEVAPFSIGCMYYAAKTWCKKSKTGRFYKLLVRKICILKIANLVKNISYKTLQKTLWCNSLTVS